MQTMLDYEVIVIGGGPAGATAANDLALSGRRVLLDDKGGRMKAWGGAIPPRAIQDFEIPEEMLVAQIRCARMVSPSDKKVDIPIENGFVGMVDRGPFDEWLRSRAQSNGAKRLIGRFESLQETDDGLKVKLMVRDHADDTAERHMTVTCALLIGADGAKSKVAAQAIADADKGVFVFAYHEILKSPAPETRQSSHPDYDADRCDVIYNGTISPDFYGWVFPHGPHLSVGTGSMDKGFSLRAATARLREQAGLSNLETIRHEGAPIPLKPLPRWDNGRNVVLAGDASGVVAPASGEGIYYAMLGGRLAAEACIEKLATDSPRALASARKRFMKEHGRVFWVLGLLQKFWYGNDKRREQFVKICRDKDVQQITFESYMNKRLVRRKPMAHLRIFIKDLAHLLGFARA